MDNNIEKQLLRDYISARENYEKLKKYASEAYENYKFAEGVLINHMKDQETERTAKYEGIGYVSRPAPKVRARVNIDNVDMLHDYLRHIHREDMIKPQVHHKTLSAFVDQTIQEGKNVPEFIEVYYEDTVRLYKDA